MEARNNKGVGDINKYINKRSGFISIGSDCIFVLVKLYCINRGIETSFSCLNKIYRKYFNLIFAQLTTAQIITKGRLKISH